MRRINAMLETCERVRWLCRAVRLSLGGSIPINTPDWSGEHKRIEDHRAMFKAVKGMSRDTIRLILEGVGVVGVIYSLYLTREALHSDNRPLVFASSFEVSTYQDEADKMEFAVDFKNEGEHPARNIWIEVHMKPGKKVSFSKIKEPLLKADAERTFVASFKLNDGSSAEELAKSIRSGEVDVELVMHYEGMNGRDYKSVYVHIPKFEFPKDLPKEIAPPEDIEFPTLHLISDG